MIRFPPQDPASAPAPDPGFDKELLAAMTAFADNTPTPVIDAAGIRRAVRRRTALAGVAAVAAVAAIATGAALLLPGSPGGGDGPAGTAPGPAVQSAPPAPASPASPAASSAPSAPVSASALAPSATEGTPSPVAPPAPGTATVTVPAVTGLSRDAATRLLDAAGLRYEVHELTDWKVPAGSVVNSEPQAGRTAAANGVVQLFVSKGRPGS
ncbi:PASTA domain-containing protein [Kitasatospora sp. NPDC127116]|uniref:PASTA domain-containing protein n=1 Tax=Kitasatospora sp. NPDC127116 TaxID=3345367 RepID=UPI0036300E1C